MTRRRAPLANWTLLGVSLAVALAAAEIALRVRVGPPVRWRVPQESYVADPVLGHRLLPGQQAYTHDAPVFVNAQGLRDVEHPVEPAPGVVRILAIGDSQTFGNGLTLDETWPKQLQRALARSAAGARFEVLNAGVPGTDTWQHERWLAELADRYRFHRVVLGFYVNDVVPAPERLPAAVSLSNGLAHRASYALRRSALVTALWQARVPLRAWLEPDPGAARERDVVAGRATPDAERGWAQVERSLAAMQAIARDAGAELVVLAIPRRDQVSSRVEETGYQRRLAAIAAAHGLAFVDALAPLRSAWREEGDALFLPWDGHDSARANAVIAASLAASLAERADTGGGASLARREAAAP